MPRPGSVALFVAPERRRSSHSGNDAHLSHLYVLVLACARLRFMQVYGLTFTIKPIKERDAKRTFYPTAPKLKTNSLTTKTTYLLTHQWIPSHHSSPSTPSSLSPRRRPRPPLPLMPTAAQAAAASSLKLFLCDSALHHWQVLYFCTLSPAPYLLLCICTRSITLH